MSPNAAPGIHFRVPTEDSPFETFYAGLWVTGDRGIRFNYNYREPLVGGSSHGRTDKFQILTGMEQDGAWFIRWEKPFTTTASTYDVGGKSLSIYSGGFVEGVGPSQTNALQTVDICGMQAGRSIRIGASPTVANPIFSAQFDPNGRVGLFNRLYWGTTSGFAPMRFPVSSGIAVGTGDVWFDGTNFKCNVGGVDKTFTIT